MSEVVIPSFLKYGTASEDKHEGNWSLKNRIGPGFSTCESVPEIFPVFDHII